MTEIFRPEMRLRVDWDGDGYLNGVVPDGTPPNLVANPIYVAPLLIQYTKNGIPYNIDVIKETTPYGFEVGRIDDTSVDGINIGVDVNLTKPDDAYENLVDWAKFPEYREWEKKFESEASPYGGVVQEYVIQPNQNLTKTAPFAKHTGVIAPKGFSVVVWWSRAKKLIDTVATTEYTSPRITITDAINSGGDITQYESDYPDITLPTDYNEWSDWTQFSAIIDATDDVVMGFTISTQGSASATSGCIVQVSGLMVIHDDLGSNLFPEITGDASQVDPSTFYRIYQNDADSTAVDYISGTGEYHIKGEVQSGYNADTETGIRVGETEGTFTFDNAKTKIMYLQIRERDSASAGDTARIDINASPYDGNVNSSIIPSYLSAYDEYKVLFYGTSTVEIRVYATDPSVDMPDVDVSLFWQVYDTGVYVPSNYYKPTGRIDNLDGLIVVDPTNDYVFTFHARAEVAANIDIQPKWVNIEDGTITLDTMVTNIDINTDWTRVDIPFSAVGGTDNHVLTVSIDYSDSTYIDLAGVMVTEGTTLYPYHVGAIAHRDVIKDDLKSVVWQSGRNNFDDAIAFEGTLEATLNNDDLDYVPKGAGSIFKQNLKVVLEVNHNFEWIVLWTGWTKSIEMVTGETTSREAYLSCVQGIELLREAEFSYQPVENTTMDETVKNLIGIAGWKSAYDNFTWQLAFNAFLGENTYLQDTDAIFSRIDEGVLIHELVGMDWGRRTKLSDALTDILNAENAKLWLDREGGLVLVNRYHEINQTTDKTINLNTDVQEANYRYGEDIVNQVEVVYSKKEEQEKQPVWNGTISIPSRNNRNIYVKSTVIVPIEFNFTEGRPITILRVYEDLKDMDVVVTANGRELEFSEWDYQVHVALNNDGSGQYYLQLRNNLESAVNVNITIYADYIEGSDAQPLVIADLEAQQEINAVHREVVENKQISNDDYATSLGLWLLNRKALPKGEFTTLLKAVQDNTDLQFIRDVQVGTVVALTENTTNETDRQHIVIAEDGSYQAGDVIRMTYTTAFMDELGYAQLGDTMEYDTLSVIPTRPSDIPMFGVDGDDTYISREDGQSIRVLDSTQHGSTFWYTEEDPRIPYRTDLHGIILFGTPNIDDVGNPFKTPEFVDAGLAAYYFHNGGASAAIERHMPYGHYRYTFGTFLQGLNDSGAVIDNRYLKFDEPIMMISNIPSININSLPTPVGSERLYTKTYPDFLLPSDKVVIFDVFGKSLDDEINAGYKLGTFDTSGDYLDENSPDGRTFGSYAIMRLDRMERYQLEPSTTYYGKINALAEGGADVEISIVELTDDMTEHINTVTLKPDYSEQSFSFTTSANCELIVIGYRVLKAGTRVKIKAMGLSETDLTLDEMEVQNKQAFRIYV